MALYLGKNKVAGTKTSSIIGDTLPVGAIVDYDGIEVPANWEQVEDSQSGAVIIRTTDSYEVCRDKILEALTINLDEEGNKTSIIVNSPLYLEMTEAEHMPYEAGLLLEPLLIDGEPESLTIGFARVVPGWVGGPAYIMMKGLEINLNNDSTGYAFSALSTAEVVTIADNLDGEDSGYVLSATQGKVLNDKIESVKKLPKCYGIHLDYEVDGSALLRAFVSDPSAEGITYKWSTLATTNYDKYEYPEEVYSTVTTTVPYLEAPNYLYYPPREYVTFQLELLDSEGNIIDGTILYYGETGLFAT